MQKFEKDYVELIIKVLTSGEKYLSRNGNTLAIFGEQLKIDLSHNNFPILQGRKIYYKGPIGEFSGFINNCDTVKEYENLGCNYWKTWADKDGHLEIDYAKQLHDFNGVHQLHELLVGLQTNPYSRRHIISLWRPDRLDELSLPCCHYAYQFHVDSYNKLHMVWIQRSVDLMVGLPSDIILAGLWLVTLAKHCNLDIGTITMQLGNVHIYEEHLDGVRQYLKQAQDITYDEKTKISCVGKTPLYGFKPSDIVIENYKSQEAIKFELKA